MKKTNYQELKAIYLKLSGMKGLPNLGRVPLSRRLQQLADAINSENWRHPVWGRVFPREIYPRDLFDALQFGLPSDDTEKLAEEI